MWHGHSCPCAVTRTDRNVRATGKQPGPIKDTHTRSGLMFNPFLLPVMLFGLGAIAIPPIIHLLNRRRFEVVDWGAMQFLQVSEVTRRRLMIEELLLMLLRMGLIAA